MFENYVKNDLKWESDLHYPSSGNVRPWVYVQNRYMDETDALRQTMAKNPFLKVFVACGYYDMATYMGGSEYQLHAPRATTRRSPIACRSATTRPAT